MLDCFFMRVLNVNTTIDLVSGGGTAERTFQVSRSLVRAGVECDILILDKGLTPERIQALAGARVVSLPVLLERYYVPRLSLRQVRNAVASADIVHLMGHWTLMNALVYLLARHFRKPYVVCPAGALPIYGRSKLLKYLYNRVVGRKLIREADAHVAIAVSELPQFDDYRVPIHSVSLIPNGINAEDFPDGDGESFRAEYGLGNNPFVLFVGRLNHIKGPDLLLRAFSEVREGFPEHRLVFAGPDSGMLTSLKDEAVRLGVEDRVHFVGYVGGGMKSEAYNAADLLAIPSRQEAMSIVALEAGATGTPVLLTDRCGFDEVEGSGGGRVVPASVEGLRDGLKGMLADSGKLESMGGKLRVFVRKQYTWDAAVERYLDLYRDILGRKS